MRWSPQHHNILPYHNPSLMPENPPPPKISPPTPSSQNPPNDLPTIFEPSFRAIQTLFKTRLKEARTRVPRMTDAWTRSDEECTAAISDHSERKRGLFIQSGLMIPTTSGRLDRTPFIELMERLDTPQTRAAATDLRLDDEFDRRGEKRDEELDELDEETLWAVDEHLLNAEGVFEPEARRHMLAELQELHGKARRLNTLRGQMSTEMRRIRLFSLWEQDFKELDELYQKHEFYNKPPSGPQNPGKKDRHGARGRFDALKQAECSGRIMELLAEMGTVRSGPEEFKMEATYKICAKVEEVVSRLDAICKDLAALK